MIIPEIRLTDQELCDAVGAFLSARGIKVPVTSVKQSYSSAAKWWVELGAPMEPIPAPEAMEERKEEVTA